jgi:NAD+-dependent protein deacetylase SIR2
LQAKYGEEAGTLKGKDFFELNFFLNMATRPWFYRFIGELKDMCQNSKPTITHTYFKELLDTGKLTRWYSQNIDGLEKLSGVRLEEIGRDSSKPKEGSAVLLHGNLDSLVCVICKHKVPFTQEALDQTKKGEWETCKSCIQRSKDRKEKGMRALREGFYRPDIVLYGESHPQAEYIGELIYNDISKSSSSILIVIGTSLKVTGVKKMVKDYSRKIKSVDPTSKRLFFINKAPLARTEWKTVFDYEYIGECDSWIKMLLDEHIPKTIPTPKLPTKSPRRLSTFFSTVKNSSTELITVKKEPTDENKENRKKQDLVVAPREMIPKSKGKLTKASS